MHYIWKFKKFSTNNLKTESGETLEVISLGTHNLLAGPDFLNAQLRIDGQHWAGNVEIHEKSSFWYAHHHEKDEAYTNVILHVVWEHNTEVFSKNNSPIATLVLKNILQKETLISYQALINKSSSFVNCESEVTEIDSFFRNRWLERLYVERLNDKSKLILQKLKESKNDWEAVLYKMLLKNFGLKINGEAFFELSEELPFSILRKNRDSVLTVEALLFGVSNMLEVECADQYFIDLKEEYKYLESKYALKKSHLTPAYFKLRPYNFPTIRLSQIASLYNKEVNLFQQLVSCNELENYYTIFDVSASNYWEQHYTFGKETTSSKIKKLSKSFIDLLIVNTILPLKFCYLKATGEDASESIFLMIEKIKKEDNRIINSFDKIGFKTNTALGSQAQLQLYNNYCSKNKCLQCEIGVKLMNR
ncbi:MAG: DUF2851 family protein [Galbibacter orientalis]|uniref:DUF2851 family protein n=1 Tax=Galbibacter orientalis TaxID=453852 RepID=UPI003001CF2B